MWLKTGIWPGWTIGDLLVWAGPGTPHTGMVGLQRVLDSLMGAQLWYAIPILLLLVILLVFEILDRRDKRRASRERVARDEASTRASLAERQRDLEAIEKR
jgi:hypothetical protein